MMNSGGVPQLNDLLRRITTGEREERLSGCVELQQFLLLFEDFKILNRDPFTVLYELDEQFFVRLSPDVKREIAKCIGAVGFIMGYKTKDYISWLFQNYDSAANDDIRSYYIQSLVATYTYDVHIKRLEKFTARTLSDVRKALELVESPQLLKPILDVIALISGTYPQLFESHFKDVTDIIIGWHIDAEQNKDTIDKCEEVLLKFQSFWIRELTFTNNLLGQFLEDAEGYAQDVGENGDKSPEPTGSPEECLLKIAPLFRVSRTVICALHNFFTTIPASSPTSKFVTEFFRRLAKIVDSICNSQLDSVYKVLKEATLCAADIAVSLENNEDRIDSQFEDLLLKIVDHPDLEGQAKYVCADAVAKLIDRIGNDNLASHVSTLIGPNGLLSKMRFQSDSKLTAKILKIYRLLLKPKSVKCLQQACSLVMSEVYFCLEVMCEAIDVKRDSLGLPADNVFRLEGVNYHSTQAEQVLIYLMGCLSELGNTKNSVIAMWAVSPTVFTLLTSQLPTVECWFSQFYPVAQHAILLTLKSHCIRHDYFLSNSDLLNPASQTASMMNSATNKNFTNILSLLSQLLREKYVLPDNRLFCLNWTLDLVETVVKSAANTAVLGNAEFEGLFLAVCDCVYVVGTFKSSCVFSVRKLIHIAKDYLTLKFYKRLFSVYTNLYCHLDAKKCKFGVESVPLEIVVHCNIDSNNFVTESGRSLRQSVMNGSQLQPSVFMQHHFKRLVDFILYDVSLMPDSNSSAASLWKQELLTVYSSVHRNGKHPYSKSPSINLLWFWACFASAEFTISSRLKTPLGKPQDTLLAIESAVKMFLNETINTEGSKVVFAAKSNPLVPWFRVRLLLSFIESLDKQMFNAYEGCAMALPQHGKVIRTFFRTNRNVVIEWLSRIRLALMTVALNNQHYSMVIRLAWQAFRDIQLDTSKAKTTSFELMLLTVVKALQSTGCSYSLNGLYNWCKDTLRIRVPWIKAAADKSIGKYESSAEGFSSTLFDWIAAADADNEGGGKDSDRTKPNLSVSAVEFIVNETLDAYLKVNDYSSALKWTDRLNELKSDQPAEYQKAFNAKLDTNYIRALGSYQKCDIEASQNYLELTPKLFGPRLVWSCADLLHFIDYRLLDAAISDRSQDGTKELTELISGSDFMHICGEWPNSIAVTSQAKLKCIDLLDKQFKSQPAEFKNLITANTDDLDAGILPTAQVNEIIYWSSVTQRKHFEGPLSQDCDHMRDLLLVGSKVERKHLNLSHSHQLLRQYLLGTKAEESNTESLPQIVLRSSIVKSPSDFLELSRHSAKLLALSHSQTEAFELLSNSINRVFEDERLQLTSFVNNFASQVPLHLTQGKLTDTVAQKLSNLGSWGDGKNGVVKGKGNVDKGILERVGKSLNLMADWMVNDSGTFGNILLQNEDSVLIKLLEEQLQSAETLNGSLDSDSVVGALLNIATIICPTLAKCQESLANWSYKAGRKVLDGSKDDRIVLSRSEVAAVSRSLPDSIDASQRDVIVNLLTTLPLEQIEETAEADLKRELLAICPLLPGVGELVKIWRSARSRLFKQYEMAAKSYFEYLRLKGPGCVGDAASITATLRILRLLVKYPKELLGVLKTLLENSDPMIWKNIIPQLFARLNHPSASVRSIIGDLICRLAAKVPDQVVYPAVVGVMSGTLKSSSGPTGGLFFDAGPQGGDTTAIDIETAVRKELDVDNSEEEVNEEDSLLKDSYRQIVDVLKQSSPELVDQIQLFIRELQRITLLRDEMWLTVLTHLQQEVTKRLDQLEKEVEKTQRNPDITESDKGWIIEEKRAIFMRMIYKVLVDLNAATSVASETANERWFADTYGQLIADALESNRHQTTQESWEPFKQLLVSLNQRANKRSSHMLEMSDISPILANMRNTPIPIPGLVVEGKPTLLAAVHSTVTILPTKTKPKKLAFVGSDGKRYSYLFKGLEDMHLDERVMQFLQICNSMFAKNKPNRRELSVYHARNYSVTPLGPRSGLIQWVEGATPIFSLYKRWQLREATAAGENTIKRPSELFFGKLAPLLEKRGIRDLENRRDWPVPVLKEVMADLVGETPCDLLQKELWCVSTDPEEWWAATRRFAQSLAVMSMIGYVIGLGDRHLDNLLVDLKEGEVVHIDYNVCFEKGKNLRVPERVPFRLTPNLVTAIGPWGVEGVFRNSCEDVLRILRSGRETLLTLLEAFVYDPLIDWTSTHDAAGVTGFVGHNVLFAVYGYSHVDDYKVLAKELAMRMFSVRIKEFSTSWTLNKRMLADSLAVLINSITSGNGVKDSHADLMVKLKDLETQQALIEEALADPNHYVYTLAERFGSYSNVAIDLATTTNSLKAKLSSCEEWIAAYSKAFGVLQNLDAKERMVGSMQLDCSGYRLTTEFLQHAGQAEKISQCKELEADANRSLMEVQQILLSCLGTLRCYADIQASAPLHILLDHRLYQWHELTGDPIAIKAQPEDREKLEVLEEKLDQFTKKHSLVSPSSHLLEADMDLIRSVSQMEEYLDQLSRKLLLSEGQEELRYTRKCAEVAVFCHSPTYFNLLLCEVLKELMKATKEMINLEYSVATDLTLLSPSDKAQLFDFNFLEISSRLSATLFSTVTLLQSANSSVEMTLGLIATQLMELFASLRCFYVSLSAGLMPTLLKAAVSEQPSFDEISMGLSNLIADVGLNLTEISEKFTAMLSGQGRNEALLLTIRAMQSKYRQLVQKFEHSSPALFNVLETLTGRCKIILNQWREISILIHGSLNFTYWTHIDLSLALDSLRSPLVDVLKYQEETLFILEFAAVCQSVSLCQEFKKKLEGESSVVASVNDLLFLFPQSVIFSCWKQCFIGYGSRIMTYVTLLLLDAVRSPEANGAMDHQLLSTVSASDSEMVLMTVVEWQQKNVDILDVQSISHNVEDLFRMTLGLQMHRFASSTKEYLSSIRNDIHHLLTVHQWVYEAQLLALTEGQHPLIQPTRTTVLTTIQKHSANIVQSQVNLAAAIDRLSTVETSIQNRLKWGVGANPDLAQVLEKFDRSLLQRKFNFEDVKEFGQELVQICKAVLHFEALAVDTPETLSLDNSVLDLVFKWVELWNSRSSVSVSPTEEALLYTKQLSTGEVITSSWLSSAKNTIEVNMMSLNRQFDQILSQCNRITCDIRDSTHAVRVALAGHHKIMLEIRAVLKSLAKYEEGVSSSTGTRFTDFIVAYKAFSEQLASSIKAISSINLLEDATSAVIATLQTVSSSVDRIYGELLDLAQLTDAGGGEKVLDDGGMRRLARSLTPVKTESFGSVAPGVEGKSIKSTDKLVGAGGQEKNAHALNIWRRVKMKLEGKVPDSSKKSTVAEQVSYVIREATDAENLALMYEGWTAWV